MCAMQWREGCGGPLPPANRFWNRANPKRSTFIIVETPERGISFPLSLNGIAEGDDRLP
jgi:invasion protein IalB